MQKRTALVFGATGLIGNLLVEELSVSGLYEKIRIFVRQPVYSDNTLIDEVVNDLSDLRALAGLVTGDDLFIALGTTIRKAGSVSNMEKIDRDLSLEIAAVALSNGVRRIAVVSSIGASSSSKNYYLRIKGEMEEGIVKLPFENIVIVRPSILLGERREKRIMESAGKAVMSALNPLMIGRMKKYRAIHGRDVARAMISLLQGEQAKKIYESDEIQLTAGLYRPSGY